MYLDSLVKVPEAKGKITFRTKGNTTYVEYESSRIYIPEKKYTTVSRKTIGKLTDADRQFMQPNENFLKFFPDTALPEEKAQAQVSKTKKQYDAAVDRPGDPWTGHRSRECVHLLFHLRFSFPQSQSLSSTFTRE